MMSWPRLLSVVLVLTLASPIRAVGNIVGPDWTYKVNDMNLLDRLRMSPSISPECASGMYPVNRMWLGDTRQSFALLLPSY